MHTPGRAVAAAPRLRWVMWSIASLLFLVGFFHRAAPGVIARDLMQTYAITGTTVGLLAATYFYANAPLMVPAGLVLDAWGVRRVLAGGGAPGGGGSVWVGAAPPPPRLLRW